MLFKALRHFGLAMVAVLPALQHTARAQAPCGTSCMTMVSGAVNGQTWTTAMSPVCVTGDLFVNSLTINPGVCVRIAPGVAINVQGSIVANGTPSQRIIFTAQIPPSRWNGIEFLNTPPGSSFAYCTFELSNSSALGIGGFTAPVIENCIFRDNTTGGSGGAVSATLSAGNLVIVDTIIEDTNPATKQLTSAFG